MTNRKTNQQLLQEEIGTILKNHGGKLRVALAYPNTYQVAMSNLGFQAVYTYLNGFDDIVCERFFLPAETARLNDPEWPRGILTTLETGAPVADYDVIAFSVPFENDFPNVVRLLRMAGIPAEQASRGARDPIVLFGGSTAYLNPEPIADFVDIVGLGEAEGIFPSLLPLLRKVGAGEISRTHFLDEVAGIPQGVYVPSRHRPEDFLDAVTDDPFHRPFLRRSYLKDLAEAPSYTRVVTPNTVFGHLYNIEIIRGCPARCLFCSVKTTQNPVRALPLSLLLELVDRGLDLTGRVGILGPSVTAHPHFDELLAHILERNGSFSLPSVRIEDLTPATLALAAAARIRTITIAPESGDIELRAALGKYYPNEEILDVIRWTFEAGIPNLKMYFMYGVPTETDAEVEATIDLVRQAAAIGRNLRKGFRIEASINPFIPKAQTAFQWSPLCEKTTLKRRGARLTRALRRLPGVQATVGGLNLAPLQMLFSRGDRSTSRVVAAVAEGRQSWKSILREQRSLLLQTLGPQTRLGAPLPWDHLVNPRVNDRLIRQYQNRVLDRPITSVEPAPELVRIS